MYGAPEGALGIPHHTGWMTKENFVKVIDHFVKFSHSSQQSPTVLVMDNHISHVSLGALEHAKKNGVYVVTLPPHTSQKSQPLDRTVFGPMKTYFNAEANALMMRRAATPITIYQMAALIGNAWMKAATPVNITAGFRASGIWPLNPWVFGDEAFLPSQVTDMQQPEDMESGTDAEDQSPDQRGAVGRRSASAEDQSPDQRGAAGRRSASAEDQSPDQRGAAGRHSGSAEGQSPDQRGAVGRRSGSAEDQSPDQRGAAGRRSASAEDQFPDQRGAAGRRSGSAEGQSPDQRGAVGRRSGSAEDYSPDQRGAAGRRSGSAEDQSPDQRGAAGRRSGSAEDQSPDQRGAAGRRSGSAEDQSPDQRGAAGRRSASAEDQLPPLEKRDTLMISISPEQLRGYPKVKTTEGRRKKRRQGCKARFANSTPELKRMRVEEAEAEAKKSKRPKEGKKSGKTARKLELGGQGEVSLPGASSDVTCIICGMRFDRSAEEWIQCVQCLCWACLPCTDVENGQVSYQSDLCRE